MRWFRAVPFLVLLAGVEWIPGCSSDDGTGAGELPDASQPAPTKFEAGASCASSDDCDPGLVCLFPASTCNALAVCVAPPGGADGGGCPAPQYACSCLGEPIEVCAGYASNPVDTTSTCEGGNTPIDSGTGDSGTGDSGAGEAGAADSGGADTSTPVNLDGSSGADATPDGAASGADASDAAGD